MAKEKQLKCFIISYNLTDEAKNAIHSVFCVAYTKKEAGDIFIKWAMGKKLYARIGGILAQEAKTTDAKDENSGQNRQKWKDVQIPVYRAV